MTTPFGRPAISVCIVCRNEGDRLVTCLESVRWANEIIVMDLESTDDSRDVAARHGARVVSRTPIPIVEPLRDEVAAFATGEWILAMDPDESVSPGLARELQALSGRDDIDLIWIPFMHCDLGYPPGDPLLRHDPKPRMYRRAKISWPSIPHALPSADPGRTLYLPKHDDFVMRHDRNRNIAEAIDRVLRYAPAQARSMVDRGEVFTARAMFSTLGEKVWRNFVLAKAFRDGIPGVLRAGLLVTYHFYVWAFFWQFSGAKRTERDDRLTARVGTALGAVRGTGRVALAPLRAIRKALGGGKKKTKKRG